MMSNIYFGLLLCLKFLNDYHFIDNIKLRNLIEVGADISHRYLALLNFLLFNIAIWFNEIWIGRHLGEEEKQKKMIGKSIM